MLLERKENRGSFCGYSGEKDYHGKDGGRNGLSFLLVGKAATPSCCVLVWSEEEGEG